MPQTTTDNQQPQKLRNAYLALGSNLDDPFAQVKQAVETISSHTELKLVSVSSAYKTPPWGVTDQPDFINAMVQVQTTLSPLALLDCCKEIESAQRRIKTYRWGPRTIDVDIIHMEGIALESERLTMPHPRFHERAFVLLPFVEIAPKLLIGDRILTEIVEEFTKNHQSSIDEVSKVITPLY